MVNDDWVVAKILEFDDKTEPAEMDKAGIVKLGNGLYTDSEGRLGVTPFYGFQIDMTISDPENCITYTGAAAALSQAERKAWAYGKVKPTVVKDGEIAYSLKRENLALKADGVTASDLTGTDGDVCASISPLWFKISKARKIISVNLSEYPQPGYISAHTFAGDNKAFLHIGMFEATGTTCDSVYSTTTTPKVSQTLKTFRTQAATKNTGLDAAVYNPMTYLTWVLYQALFVFAYGTINSQSKGNGNVSTSAAIAVGKSDLLTCSGEYGLTNASNTHVMALFVVNPWGNVWKFCDGCIWNGGNFAVLDDQSKVYDIETGWSEKPSSWHVAATGLGTSLSAQYITEFSGDTHAGFFPCAAANGSSATHACDACWSATGEKCCVVGGRWSRAAFAGAFAVNVNYALASSLSYFGARLQILNLT